MGKLVAGGLVAISVIAGAALYYLQVYAYYEDVVPRGPQDVMLVARASQRPEPIPHSNFRAIDAQSSPIRYRACFDTPQSLDALAQTYVSLDRVAPRNAPGWFECFDARVIAEQLDAGQARLFLAGKNVAFGVDRIVAITTEGRGFAWHELNDCGEKAYDGTIIGEECPPPPNAETE